MATTGSRTGLRIGIIVLVSMVLMVAVITMMVLVAVIAVTVPVSAVVIAVSFVDRTTRFGMNVNVVAARVIVKVDFDPRSNGTTDEQDQRRRCEPSKTLPA